MDATEQAAADKAAEEKAATDKVAAEKAATEKATSEQDAAVEKLGADFDKKADTGDEHSAYTESADEKAAREKTEADAKASEEAEKARAEEEGKSKLDEDLLARAEQAGMIREKAEEFSSKEDLERAIKLLEESQSKAKPGETEAEKKIREEAEAKVKTEAEAKVEDDKKPYDCGLNAEEYDENLIKVLNELGTMLKKRVVALEASHSKHTGILDSNRVTKHTDWLDSKINRLSDDDLKKIYGEGDIDDLEEGSDEFKARAALDTKIASIVTGLRKTNKTIPSRNKLFNMAIEALHKGKKQKVDTKTADKLKDRAKQSVGPGSSKASAESVEAEVIQDQKDFDIKLDED